LTVADVFLVPFVPRSFDIWTIEKASSLIKEIQPVNPKLKGFTFLNRADPAGPDNADAAKELESVEDLAFLDTPIVYRKAFGKAAAQGIAVTELRPSDDKAIQEIEALFLAVFEKSPTATGKTKSREMENV
jgi:chromosome partitioning protein